jgi:hypothetical protein
MFKAFAFAALLCLPFTAFAQETPQVEVFGGFTYVTSGDDDTTGSGSGFVIDPTNLKGWHASATYNVNKWLGVEADFSQSYKSKDLTVSSVAYETNAKLFTYHVGPKFTYRASKFQPFAHALIGGTRGDYSVESASARSELDTNDFSTIVGGGLDIPLNSRISVRAIQADWLAINSSDDWASKARISTGVVFRFGSK